MTIKLPQTVDVNGTTWRIRSDFRHILKIISAFNDPDLQDSEKVYITLVILYKDFDDIPKDDYEAAFKAALDFIDHGVAKADNAKSPRIMDWEQDESIMFPAINKVAGFETRSAKYIHWWTFLGYYMEISEGVFSNVLSLRLKRAKGKPFEKWEREYWSANKDICVLKKRISAEEQAERDRLNALLDQ